ncbi:lanthionine synthetase LanC family protein [Saccharopolyspora cebuensis]|uniref:LanC n=1 Tax=Saccharopolyspora cebuensis TaxID=418759 RepID=A0A481XVJ8_9PSEU|nr:LanC [Saccharopolyspora cebuensis]
MTAVVVAEQVRLARRLHADAAAQVAERPTFPLLLDQALTAMEFAAALGEDVDARTPFREAMAALRAGTEVGPWLYRGAAQAGWVAIQLARFRGATATGLGPIDDAVLGWLEAFPAEHDLDLPMGALGLGVYGLVHPDPAVRDRITAGVLDVVEDRTERDDAGRYFRLSDSPARRADGSAGSRILGAAHGAAGLVSYLASAALAGGAPGPRARWLLDEARRWLVGHRADVGGTVFPHRVETRYVPSRATWCTGDPGIGLALSVAAEATGDAGTAALAEEVGRRTLARAPQDCGVLDGCLCHGAAALCWYGRRLRDDHGADSEGFTARWAGWLAEARAEGPLTYFSPDGMVRNASFLEGDAGVALALLHAATGGSPSWQQLLLAAPVR